MKSLKLIPVFISLFPQIIIAQIGKDGNVVITNTQIVNTYTTLSQNANPGDLTLTVNNSNMAGGTFANSLSPGDLVMIIQIQGATIQGNVNNISWGEILSYNNCGLFEFKEVADVPNGTHIELTCPVENSYSQNGKVQVIRVPRYNTLTVDGGTITSLNWNGNIGGIVAIEVNGITTLINGGKIDVTGQGFRGGLLDNQSSYAQMNFAYPNQNAGGAKGESIAGFGPEYAPLGGQFGRGAPANGGGGGNAHNAGGGGGANAGNEIPWNGLGNPNNSVAAYTTAWNLEGGGFSANLSSGGGRGGYTFSSSNMNALAVGPGMATWGGDNRNNTGGIGGRPLDYSSGRLFFGGGGGAGDGNNGAGTNGASGGGLVYLLTYNDVVGNGMVVASGQTAPVTPPNGNDAPGGGGGGGTIVINSLGNISSTISLIAHGGNGGNQFILTNEAEGPGGGGGGGYISYSNGTPITNVNGGANGTTNSLGVTEFPPNGATGGGVGSVAFPIITSNNMHVIAMNDTICINANTTLTASAENPSYNNQIQWFDEPYGGNLLSTGTSFTTPNLTTTTTYYLKVCPSFFVDSVTVYVENLPVFAVVTDSTTCYNGNDGSATTNSMGVYTYQWSNGQNGISINGLSAGNYNVTAYTQSGCSSIQNFSIQQPAPIAINFSGTPALCFNEPSGSISANANGGVGPYNYYWPVQNVTGQNLTNVSNGSYVVEVTDANNCSNSDTGSVTSPLPLTPSIISLNDVSCNGGNDGSIQVAALGGTIPYSINWSPIASTNFTITNLIAGNYIAEITDANNCVASLVGTISEPVPFTANLNVLTDETCSNANGVAYVATSGGIGILQYNWTPSVSSTALATGLQAGNYQVTVQDENGCIADDNIVLVNHATGVPTITSIDTVSCQNGTNGGATITMIGGSSPFIYNWSCLCSSTSSVSNLSAGIYEVIVEDFYGCIDSIEINIPELPTLILSTNNVVNPLCFGDANGEIFAEATGGEGPYFFAWNTMPAQYNNYVTSLTAGTYTGIVTDANNCTDTLMVNLIEPIDLNISINILSNILCYGDSAGVLMSDITGGTAPYNLLWNNGMTSDSIYNLASGTYSLNVEDANGCFEHAQATIIEYQNVVAELVADTVFCPGDLVTFTVLTNGLNNLYEYNWYVNGFLQSTQNTYTIPIYSNTEVSIDLVNQVNCPDIYDSIVVEPIQIDPGILTLSASQDTLCPGEGGFILASISDWQYLTEVSWNNGLFGPGAHNVKPGETTYYTATVTNMCNQTITDSIKIDVFEGPNAWVYAEETTGCDQVNAVFGYDYAPYGYDLTGIAWHIVPNNYSVDRPVVNFTVSGGVYASVGLTFSNGCTFSFADTIQMTVYPSPEANFYYNPIPAMQGELTEFVDISHGNPVAWEWYTENQLISTEERTTWIFNEQGNFAVMQVVTNEYGCSDTSHQVIEVIGDYSVYVPNAFTPDGNGFNNEFKPVFQNVKPDNYQFLIFNRWGELIFETNSLDASWDGSYQGDQVIDDVYVWVIRVTDNRDIAHEYTGHVTLLK